MLSKLRDAWNMWRHGPVVEYRDLQPEDRHRFEEMCQFLGMKTSKVDARIELSYTTAIGVARKKNPTFGRKKNRLPVGEVALNVHHLLIRQTFMYVFMGASRPDTPSDTPTEGPSADAS